MPSRFQRIFLKRLTAEAMGLPEFDEAAFAAKVEEIQVPENGTLVFVFYDGHTVTKLGIILPAAIAGTRKIARRRGNWRLDRWQKGGLHNASSNNGAGNSDPCEKDRLPINVLSNEARKLRVAAYARVSTNNEEQLTSYEAQVDYYTRYIQSKDEWEFIEVYTDEGISATNTKKRDGFNRMVADALAGKKST